jgi:thioredoxin 1
MERDLLLIRWTRLEAEMLAVRNVPIHASGSTLDPILATGWPTLIVFERPECAPCRGLVPLLEVVAEEYAGRVLVVRVEDAREGWLAARYHLSVVPTLVFWRGQTEEFRIKGNPGLAPLRAHLEFLLTREIPPDPASGPRHTLDAVFGVDPRPGERRIAHLLCEGVAS